MNAIFIIGRILLGGFFIINGFNHFKGFKGMVGYAKSKHVPVPHLAVGTTGLMLLLGGLSVIFNVQIIIGMWILVIFLIPVTVMMHPFWKEKDPMMRMNDQIGFMKNVAILGALLMMITMVI